MLNVDLVKLGKICKCFRKQLGYYQYQVGNDLGYSLENISAFERGCNDNTTIFLWYIQHGLRYDDIKEVIKNV